MAIETVCAWCFQSMKVSPSHYRKDNYCCTQCWKDASAAACRARNKTLMTPEIREKLREAKLGKGEGKTYTKTFGRHTHRIVAEQLLGRPLRPGEVVHHIDGNKRNNDPSNLMVFASQKEHAAWHAAAKRGEVMSDAFQALSVSAESD